MLRPAASCKSASIVVDPTVILFTHQLQHAIILVVMPDKSLYSRIVTRYRSFDCLYLLAGEMPSPARIPIECSHEILEGAPELHVVSVQWTHKLKR